MTLRYLVSPFTERVIVPSFISFAFLVLLAFFLMFFQKLLLLRIRIDDCSLVRLSNVLDAILRILRDDYSLVR